MLASWRNFFLYPSYRIIESVCSLISSERKTKTKSLRFCVRACVLICERKEEVKGEEKKVVHFFVQVLKFHLINPILEDFESSRAGWISGGSCKMRAKLYHLSEKCDKKFTNLIKRREMNFVSSSSSTLNPILILYFIFYPHKTHS
jgi:hypothetical protein